MKSKVVPAVLVFLFAVFSATSAAAQAKGGVTVVSLFSETGEGYISARVGKADWVPVKIGDTIAANAEIRVNVDRDWMELTPSNDPTKVFRLDGSETGEIVKKVSDVLKGPSRSVKFPKVGKETDPAFKDKLVVKQFIGRQIYRASPDTKDKDIQYGDVLDIKGRVRIIGINNTLVLMFPNGAETTVVGPLSFDIEKVFTGSNLYKYLNVK